ncbi:hypothetical protein OG604_16850 [Streptomyces sp. NBC_01231]|nr:hypothetical protein OG604_16850 [Streptomyces sp. NBC_01231]
MAPSRAAVPSATSNGIGEAGRAGRLWAVDRKPGAAPRGGTTETGENP